MRDAVQEGRADFMPVFLSEIPELIRSRRVRIDVALIQVSPPDAHGYVSLGVSVDIVRGAVDVGRPGHRRGQPAHAAHARRLLPARHRIARLVPVDDPAARRTPASRRTTSSAQSATTSPASCPNGATLQTGIGKIPDAVLAHLGGHNDLGVHTEMLSDGIMNLVEAGVITGRKKTILLGKMVTSFIMGSQKLYEWAHDHPAIEMRPSDFTNDPQVIARNEQMIAINSALAVDLTGQVAADTLLGRFFSGIGGQVDFMRGARAQPRRQADHRAALDRQGRRP